MNKPLITLVLACAAIGTLAWTASDIPSVAPSSQAPPSQAPSSLVLLSVDALVIPVAGIERAQIRDTFNEGRAGHVHHALDILAPKGTPVLSAVDGRVRKIFTSKAGGLTVYASDRDDAKMYYYAHLDSYAAGLHEGMELHSGEVIGYVGTTGNARQTPHLHFAVAILPPTKEWWKGEPVNPYHELVQRGVTVQR